MNKSFKIQCLYSTVEQISGCIHTPACSLNNPFSYKHIIHSGSYLEKCSRSIWTVIKVTGDLRIDREKQKDLLITEWKFNQLPSSHVACLREMMTRRERAAAAAGVGGWLIDRFRGEKIRGTANATMWLNRKAFRTWTKSFQRRQTTPFTALTSRWPQRGSADDGSLERTADYIIFLK